MPFFLILFLGPCLKAALSKGLGYGIILGSVMGKFLDMQSTKLISRFRNT